MKRYFIAYAIVLLITLILLNTWQSVYHNQRIKQIQHELTSLKQNLKQSIQRVKQNNAKTMQLFQADINRQMDNIEAKNRQNWKFWNEFFTGKASE